MLAKLGGLRGIATGIALVIGFFLLLFGAIPGLLTGVWRTYHEHTVEARWIGAAATIEKCALSVHEPSHGQFRDAGAFFDQYSLHCRLRYEISQRLHVFNLHTLSDSSGEARAAIEKWVEVHRPGSTMEIRVNPSNPNDIAVASQLPIPQSGTARQAWSTAMYCGVGFVLFFGIFRIIRPAAPPGA
ncbi:MAG TPA: DUF3592 domain-containing protein [Bryobacteraceae bacterium]|nr:DUF3592 domain-containing protein [Bryobacteraceae bacterium]